MITRYRLGLPVWGARAWLGSLYTRAAPSSERLAQYASVFNAVEGNATFYAIPTPERVEGWVRQVPSSFGFSFKVPRVITHERRMVGAEQETAAFLLAMEAAQGCLGPTMLQLPPSLGPSELPALTAYLDALPAWLTVAVELRHPAFFTGRGKAEVETLLATRGVERVLLDRRALNASVVDDDATREARRKKPNLPVYPGIFGEQPVVRYIADPDLVANEPWLGPWAERFVAWIAEGRTPVMFVHLPGDSGAPQLARTWHEMLRARGAPVGELPTWPGEAEEVAVQPSLFDEDEVE